MATLSALWGTKRPAKPPTPAGAQAAAGTQTAGDAKDVPALDAGEAAEAALPAKEVVR
jgi:hypothetical protein